jgi:hypothetical protein
LREFEEIEISSKAVEVTINNKDENSVKNFVWLSEFGPWLGYTS